MKVAVWDTYVQRPDNSKMHFDILVPEEEINPHIIHQYGQEYLKGKNVLSEILSSKQCEFCHIEEASDSIISSIKSKGYHIIEMENCK